MAEIDCFAEVIDKVRVLCVRRKLISVLKWEHYHRLSLIYLKQTEIRAMTARAQWPMIFFPSLKPRNFLALYKLLPLSQFVSWWIPFLDGAKTQIP